MTGDTFDDRPSKSQRKRDMQALRELAERLTALSGEHLEKLADQQLREAVTAAMKITKGNARKRQIQYIAKLLSRIDPEPARELVESLDAGSAAYTRRFHQLETWREQLVTGNLEVMDEILAAHPGTDRPQLRSLVRQAAREREQGEGQVYFRRLFQFLKTLDEGD